MFQMFRLFRAYVTNVYSKYFIYFGCTLQVFCLDVAMATHICCKCIFQMFHLFSDVCCSKYFMFQVYILGWTTRVTQHTSAGGASGFPCASTIWSRRGKRHMHKRSPCSRVSTGSGARAGRSSHACVWK
jgi:hypothetical protein